MVRQYVAWLNSESLELGGPFVEPLPLECVSLSSGSGTELTIIDFRAREIYAHYASTHYRKVLPSLICWLTNSR
jgi:hypothetical protein